MRRPVLMGFPTALMGVKVVVERSVRVLMHVAVQGFCRHVLVMFVMHHRLYPLYSR